MSETVDSSSGGDVRETGDASSHVTTSGVIQAPEAAPRSRWTPQRIAGTAVAVAVVAFLVVKSAFQEPS